MKTLCQWYALCDHVAVAHVSHPILVAVPTCQRCIDKHELSSQRVRVIADRDERDSCQKLTAGCCVDHALDVDDSCEGW